MSAADVASNVRGGSQEVAARKAAVPTKRSGSAVHVIAGREGHVGGGGAGPPRHQVIGALAEVEAGESRQELISGES